MNTKDLLKYLSIKLTPEFIRRTIKRLGVFYMTDEEKLHLPKISQSWHIKQLKIKGYLPDLIIDIGAYVGEWSLMAREIFPNSKILMIEPQRSKENILRELAKKYDNVDFKIALLGNKIRSKIKFYSMETGSSIFSENTDYPRRIEIMSMTTLDALMKNQKTGANVLIKIDAQGAEQLILQGARQILMFTEVLVLELSLLKYNEGSPLFDEMIHFLSGLDFALYDIIDQRRNRDQVLFQVDLIFVKKNHSLREHVLFK